MRGGSTQRALYIGGVDRPNRTKAATSQRGSSLQRTSGNLEQPMGRRGARKKSKEINVYRRRRILAICVVLLGALALVFAAFTQTSGSRERTLPIDPNNAVPDVLLAEVAGVGIFTPIRPEELTGLGYH